MSRCLRLIGVPSLVLVLMAIAGSASGGQAASTPTPQQTFTGNVVSVSKATVVVKADDGTYQLFSFDNDSTKPTTIPVGATIRVSYTPVQQPATPVAAAVRITAMPPSAAAEQGAAQAQAAPADEPIPQSVRNAEKAIQRQANKYHLGFRGGAAIDPELISLGVHAQLGPFYKDSVFARPNLEFAFGEVTKLVGLNLEAVYRTHVTEAEHWSLFFGGGPALSFDRKGFNSPDGTVSYGDWGFDVGLNMIVGVQSKSGAFMEFKTCAWAEPTMRFIVGYSF